MDLKKNGYIFTRLITTRAKRDYGLETTDFLFAAHTLQT